MVREVRRQRGPRFRRAAQGSVPIETAPGEECQFDWSDCSARGQEWGPTVDFARHHGLDIVARQAGQRPGPLHHQGGARGAPGDRAVLLGPLPRRRFDTAYVEARRVHVTVPLVEWGAVRYSVPPEALGQLVAARVEVDAVELEISWGGRAIARHRLAPAGSDDVWDAAHRGAAEAGALGRSRPPLRLVPAEAVPSTAECFATLAGCLLCPDTISDLSPLS